MLNKFSVFLAKKSKMSVINVNNVTFNSVSIFVRFVIFSTMILKKKFIIVRNVVFVE